MKGVILAGGLGTRLQPLTLITNKHLLPVYDRPMILYPLDTLKRSGVTEIIIVCGREHAGHFMNFLGSGKAYGVQISYAIQDTDNGGIADALSYAEDFSDRKPIAVILGDNIFENDFRAAVQAFSFGAVAFFKKVENPSRFGVPVFSDDHKTILRVDEKPEKPQSPYAQSGFFLFDGEAFDKIRTLTPSARGELEMTDLVNRYIEHGALTFEEVKGEWMDAGTFDSLHRAAVFFQSRSKR